MELAGLGSFQPYALPCYMSNEAYTTCALYRLALHKSHLMLRNGFAARCEAGLCPAVSSPKYIRGSAPGAGSARKP